MFVLFVFRFYGPISYGSLLSIRGFIFLLSLMILGVYIFEIFVECSFSNIFFIFLLTNQLQFMLLVNTRLLF